MKIEREFLIKSMLNSKPAIQINITNTAGMLFVYLLMNLVSNVVFIIVHVNWKNKYDGIIVLHVATSNKNPGSILKREVFSLKKVWRSGMLEKTLKYAVQS